MAAIYIYKEIYLTLLLFELCLITQLSHVYTHRKQLMISAIYYIYRERDIKNTVNDDT